jgi:hypothetical protein
MFKMMTASKAWWLNNKTKIEMLPESVALIPSMATQDADEFYQSLAEISNWHKDNCGEHIVRGDAKLDKHGKAGLKLTTRSVEILFHPAGSSIIQ